MFKSFLMWESHSAQSFYILHAWCARMPRTGADAARAAVCGTSVSFQRYLTVMMPIGVQVFLCVRSYSAQSFYTSCLTRAVAARAAFCGTGVSFAVTILKDNLNRGSTVSWREKVILQVDKRERLTKTKTQPKAREKGTRWKKVKRENRQIHGSQILNHFLGPMNNKTCDKERKPRVCPACALPQDCLRWQHSPSSKMPASSVSNFSYVRMVARACWWCSSPSF